MTNDLLTKIVLLLVFSFQAGCASLLPPPNNSHRWSTFDDDLWAMEWRESRESRERTEYREEPAPTPARGPVSPHGTLSGDVWLGMQMPEVHQSWGDPIKVQSAGDPSMGNQRWVYPDQFGTYSRGARVIYFENGRVVGWEHTSR